MAANTRKKPSTPAEATGTSRRTRSASTRTKLVVPEIKAEVLDVTPELAQEWMKGNISNRRLNERTVNLYTRDMLADKWPLNGEAIKRAADNTLLDGQHRLEAVIRSGKTIKMLVISGLPPETQETMDLGRKRNASDTLTLRGESNTTALSSIARRVTLWDRGDRSFREVVTFAEMSETLDKHPEIRRSAELAVRVHNAFRFLPTSSLGTAHHLMLRVDPERVPWFFGAIETGAGLDLGNPVLTLRERVRSDRESGQKVGDVRALAYLVRAWNANRKGATLARIQHPVGTPVPDIL
jgi:hypothetical protein